MRITASRTFRCHYRHAVPGQEPVALFIELRARDADAARRFAEAALGRQVDRVEPAPFPFPHHQPRKGGLPMHAFTVQVIDADRVFHAYIQLAESRAQAEDIAFARFGHVRLLSVRRAS